MYPHSQCWAMHHTLCFKRHIEGEEVDGIPTFFCPISSGLWTHASGITKCCRGSASTAAYLLASKHDAMRRMEKGRTSIPEGILHTTGTVQSASNRFKTSIIVSELARGDGHVNKKQSNIPYPHLWVFPLLQGYQIRSGRSCYSSLTRTRRVKHSGAVIILFYKLARSVDRETHSTYIALYTQANK